MKKIFVIMAVTSLFGLFGCNDKNDPSLWSDRQVNKWFEKGEWLDGWTVKPDETINRRELAVSYFKHQDRWHKAFLFLKDHDFTKMELKRYDIDGDNLYAPVSEYYSKREEDAKYEAHQKYIDIQYVASGKELIGIGKMNDLKETLQNYDAAKDVMFMSVNNIKNYTADPGRFFVFFPDDLHRPGMRDGDSTLVRKVVIKIRID